MPKIYIAEIVNQIRAIYQSAPISGFTHTADLIDSHANLLMAEHKRQNPAAAVPFNNWHPNLIGKDQQQILSMYLNLDDALLALSKEFGYVDWDDAQSRNTAIDQDFEVAVDYALQGNLAGLDSALELHPELAKQTSSFGHAATILLYLGSNGVEFWRQIVPENICDVVELLTKRGSNPHATMNVYGGHFNVLALAQSSAHPKDSGVAKELIPLLEKLLAQE